MKCLFTVENSNAVKIVMGDYLAQKLPFSGGLTRPHILFLTTNFDTLLYFAFAHSYSIACYQTKRPAMVS